MVKRRRPWPGAVQTLKCIRGPAAPEVEELEDRLEQGLLAFGSDGPTGNPSSIPPWLEPCGCLGTLCACDGHDCAGVCAQHCLPNYV